MSRRRRIFLMALVPVVTGAAVAAGLTTALSASASTTTDCAMQSFIVRDFAFFDGASNGQHDNVVIKADLTRVIQGTSVPRLGDQNEKMYAITFLQNFDSIDGARTGGRLDGVVIREDLAANC
jgi:hypothetical protein